MRLRTPQEVGRAIDRLAADIDLVSFDVFDTLIRRPVLPLARTKVPAARAVDTATTSGTARPSACGQAITITVTVRSMAKAKSFPIRKVQMNIVTAPPNRAMKVSHCAARPARSRRARFSAPPK